jgi:hypothetical protein
MDSNNINMEEKSLSLYKDRDDLLISENETDDLYVGKLFVSWQKVIVFLNTYCMQKGFSYRRGRSTKMNNDEDAVKRTFLCKHAGTNKVDKTTTISEQRNKTSCRINCPWHVNINKKGEGIYMVTTFVNEHKDHTLNPQTTYFSSQFRKLTEDMLADIRFWTLEGDLSATKQYRMLTSKYQCTIIKQDLYNAINMFRRKKEPAKKNAFNIINSLLEKKANESEWIVEYQIDPISQSLTHILWMEPQQVELYIRYGSVVAHDNTAKTNIYGLPLSIFVVVDNNYNTRPVAQAFLYDETLESYAWSLRVLLQALGIYPTVMITDANPAMDAAIAQIYPQTKHLHCIWHIGQNIPKNLKSKLQGSYEEFAKRFFQCRNKLSIEGFENGYMKLIEDYPSTKSYLERLYESKKSWARCYTSSYFTAGMQLTSRVESINGVIKKDLDGRCVSLNSLCASITRILKERQNNKEFIAWKESMRSHLPTYTIQYFKILIMSFAPT